MRHADKIFVLSRGSVVEEGSHEELCALKGAYSRMLARQEKNNNGVEELNLTSLSQDSDDSLVLEDNTPDLTGI